MTALYPARHYRFDIHFPVTILACSMSKPTTTHLRHLKHLVGYVRRTRDYTLELGGDQPQIFEIYCDASHAIHPDGKGQGSYFVLLGGRVVHFTVFKLKHITLSSTESELSAASETVSMAMWLDVLAKELGLVQSRPIILHQDNQSAIFMNDTNTATFKRAKHIFIRKMLINESIESGLIKQRYTCTEEMIGDLGTKIHGAARLQQLCEYIKLG